MLHSEIVTAKIHSLVFGQGLTCFEDLPPDERKRQREALRRRMHQPGAAQNHLNHCLFVHLCQTVKLGPSHAQFFSFGTFVNFPGLKPGLLAKYQSARTSAQKFELLKAFTLDESMNSVHIETEYLELAMKDDNSQWVELPLSQIRTMYSNSEAEKRFVETNIVGQQNGRRHPQDPDGSQKEMRLYWVFRENSENIRNR